MSKKTLKDHEAEISCWFCGVTRDPNCMDTVKRNIKEFSRYAYIIHEPDNPKNDKTDEEIDADSGLHLHFILYTRVSKSVRQVAEMLDLPSNYIQVVRVKRNLIRYFMHLDNPEKKQYKDTDIVTNRRSLVTSAIEDNDDDDIRRLFSNLRRLRCGEISVDDFVDAHYLALQKMPCYQQIRLYSLLCDQASADLPDGLRTPSLNRGQKLY